MLPKVRSVIIDFLRSYHIAMDAMDIAIDIAIDFWRVLGAFQGPKITLV